MKQTAIFKTLIYLALGAWALISILLLCCEETPGSANLGATLEAKAFATASLLACIFIGIKAERAGMMPDFWYRKESKREELK